MKIAPQLEPFCVPMDGLRPAPDNARVHDSQNIQDIKDSLQQFGQMSPIVIDQDNIIRKGNGTWMAAQQLGAKVIAAVRVEHLTPEELKRYELADNAVGDSSKWDSVLLLVNLRETGPVPGISQEEINRLLAGAEHAQQQTQGFNPNIVGREIAVAAGDLFQCGNHRILCGDSTKDADVKRLMGKERADLVFTDPPYGVSYDSRSDAHEKLAGDDLRDDALLQKLLVPSLRLAVKYAKDDAAFYVWHASDTRRDFEQALSAVGLVEKQYIIWDKGTFVLGWGHYRHQAEPCFYCHKQGQAPKWNEQKDQSTIWSIGMLRDADVITSLATGVRISDGDGNEIFVAPRGPKGKKFRLLRLEEGQNLVVSNDHGNVDLWKVQRDAAKDYIHPTMKPADLSMRAMSNNTSEGDIVLDLFGGSGSTMMGAERMNRRAFTMELDPAYCASSIRRFEAATELLAELL